MIPNALRFVNVSAATYVQCGALSDTAALTSETRIVWCMLTSAPSGNNVICSQGGGGPSNWLFSSTPAFNYTRDFSTTDANVGANLAAVNCTIGQPFFGAVVLDAGAPRLYGGTLSIPAAEATSYNAQTTAVGTVVDKSANQYQIGGFQGFGQGFGGVIWLVAQFDFAMTLSQLREVQYAPERWITRAVHYWPLGQVGGGVVADRTGRGAEGVVTGAVPVAEVLPRIAA